MPQAWGAKNESQQHLACATHSCSTPFLPQAFAYVGPPGPPPTQPPVDMEDGWTAEAMLSMGLRAWPYVLTGLVGVITIHWAYKVFTQCLVQSEMVKAANRERARSVEFSSISMDYSAGSRPIPQGVRAGESWRITTSPATVPPPLVFRGQ